MALAVDGLNWLGVNQWYNPGETGSQAVGVQSLKSVFQIELWEPALSRETGPPGPRLSSPGERKRRTAMAWGAGGSICCSLCSPLTHNPFNKVRGIFFQICVRSSLLRRYVSECISVCIVGCDDTTYSFCASSQHFFGKWLTILSQSPQNLLLRFFVNDQFLLEYK